MQATNGRGGAFRPKPGSETSNLKGRQSMGAPGIPKSYPEQMTCVRALRGPPVTIDSVYTVRFASGVARASCEEKTMPNPEKQEVRVTPGPRHSQSCLKAGLFLLVITILAGCGTSGLNRPVVEVTATPKESKQVAEISLHSFYFEPNRLVVKAGIPVELKLKKKSLFVPHNFSLYAPEAGMRIDQNVGTLGFLPGSKTVLFTPTRPGEYEFTCGKDHHASEGMKGILVVQP